MRYNRAILVAVKRNFSIRVEETLVDRIKAIAADYDIKPARVIENALRIYAGLIEQNGGVMLSPGQLAEFTKILHGELGRSYQAPEIVTLRAAETPHEPGKIISPAGAGGADPAQKKTYRTGTTRKS